MISTGEAHRLLVLLNQASVQIRQNRFNSVCKKGTVPAIRLLHTRAKIPELVPTIAPAGLNLVKTIKIMNGMER